MLSWITNPVVAGLVGELIGSLVTFAGSTNTFLNRDRELDTERVSLSILAGDDKENSLPGRKVALRALSNFSAVEISDQEFNEWAVTGTLPPSLAAASSDPLETLIRYFAVPGVFRETFRMSAFVRQKAADLTKCQEKNSLEKCLGQIDLGLVGHPTAPPRRSPLMTPNRQPPRLARRSGLSARGPGDGA